MSSSFVEYIDIIGSNAHRAPLVKGGIRAYYATGSDGIEETAAQIAAAKAAGMGVILIDQTPSLSVFAAGLAAVADVEPDAGTPESAASAVEARLARGETCVLYVSYDAWAGLSEAVRNTAGVYYWIADYSWSIEKAEAFLNTHPNVVAVQYGDPASNPNTMVPGTGLTLRDVSADINVAKDEWAATFLAPPPPPPAPRPVPTPPPAPAKQIVHWRVIGKHRLVNEAKAHDLTPDQMITLAAQAGHTYGPAMQKYIKARDWDALLPELTVLFAYARVN